MDTATIIGLSILALFIIGGMFIFAFVVGKTYDAARALPTTLGHGAGSFARAYAEAKKGNNP